MSAGARPRTATGSSCRCTNRTKEKKEGASTLLYCCNKTTFRMKKLPRQFQKRTPSLSYSSCVRKSCTPPSDPDSPRKYLSFPRGNNPRYARKYASKNAGFENPYNDREGGARGKGPFLSEDRSGIPWNHGGRKNWR